MKSKKIKPRKEVQSNALKAAAYHEIGHAIVQYRCTNYPPFYIEIGSEDGAFGKVTTDNFDTGNIREIENYVIGLLGGYYSETLLFETEIKRARKKSQSDLDKIDKIISNNIKPKQRSLFLRKCRNRCRKIIKLNAYSIKLLMELLFSLKKIEGQSFEYLMLYIDTRDQNALAWLGHVGKSDSRFAKAVKFLVHRLARQKQLKETNINLETTQGTKKNYAAKSHRNSRILRS